LGDVKAEEPCVADDGVVVDVADEDEDEERNGDEVESEGDNGGIAASFRGCHGDEVVLLAAAEVEVTKDCLMV
jgi:hypothetical protein